MITIIAGSRTLDDYEDFLVGVNWARCIGIEPSQVVSGCQRTSERIPHSRKWRRYGADYFGELWAEDHGLPIIRMPAEWDDLTQKGSVIKVNKQGQKYDSMAGLRRNEKMARTAEALICVRVDYSPGSTDMIKRAKAHGLKVFVYDIETFPSDWKDKHAHQ